MTVKLTTLCVACSRFRGRDKCLAFPNGIPEDIQRFGEPHLKPVPGDGGFTFNLKAGADAAEAFENWKKSHRLEAG